MRYGAAVLGFMGGLQPRLEIGGCLFTHVEPWLDPHKVEDLWYFDGPPDSPEKLAKAYKPQELAHDAYRLYERFRPDIPAGKKGWGAKGDLDLGLIGRLTTEKKAGSREATR